MLFRSSWRVQGRFWGWAGGKFPTGPRCKRGRSGQICSRPLRGHGSDGRVPCHQLQGLLEQGLARLHPVPWRRAGWVRQGDAVQVDPRVAEVEAFPDQVVHRGGGHELRDGELAHGPARDPRSPLCRLRPGCSPVPGRIPGYPGRTPCRQRYPKNRNAGETARALEYSTNALQ